MNRLARRSLLLLAALVMSLTAVSAAFAESEWQIFDTVCALTGPDAAKNGDLVMRRDLYHGVVDGMEFAVTEAGYDGMSLFLRYTFRMPKVDYSFGVTAAEVYGDELPEGISPDSYVEGLAEKAEETISNWHYDWWYDQFWIDGKGVDIASGTMQHYSGSGLPGELIVTDYRPLYNEGITLNGKVRISLPLGKKPASVSCTREENPGMFDEKGLLLPDEGVVTFELDTKDIASQVRFFHPEQETDLPGFSAKVEEVAFSPLMTYISLDLFIKPGAFEAFVAEYGECATDENGEVMWEYTPNDIFSSWLGDLKLADGNGTLLFPAEDVFEYENDTEKADFIFPYIDVLPDSLYLAPYDYDTEQVDMSRAVKVI